MEGFVTPLVSIIVPSFNQAQYILATLESISSQDYGSLEVLVIDGASTDGTVEVLREYQQRDSRLRWWSRPDSGVAEAVNEGLRRARGEFAAIQSSDDVYFPGAVSAAVQALLMNPQVGIVYSNCYPLRQDGSRYPPTAWESYSLARLLCGRTFIMQNSAFFRLELARQVGGWRPDYFVADVDMWLRMLEHTTALQIPGLWSGWRKHPDQRNNQSGRIHSSYTRMLQEANVVRRGPWQLRCAAAAGWRILLQEYNPNHSTWQLRWRLWQALFIYPPSFWAIRDKATLVPGMRTLLRRLGVRAK
nr:glycosyltransferase [Oceanococcus sp. HetDA_MAG_MS8]